MDMFIKDPAAVLDYVFDWSKWLAVGETITTQSTVASTGLTVDKSTISADGTTVTVWLSGGTEKQTYTVTNHIETISLREDDRAMLIQCLNR
jgi:hypothetical protein